MPVDIKNIISHIKKALNFRYWRFFYNFAEPNDHN